MENPTVATLLEVERILAAERRAGNQALSLSEIARRMPARKVRTTTIRAAVQVLRHFGAAQQDEAGVRHASQRSTPVAATELYAAHDELLRPILSKYGVRKVVAFGSRTTGAAKPTSDLDLAVAFRRRGDGLDLLRLQVELEDVLGVRVDACPLPSPNADLQKAIDKGIVLYEA